LDDAHREAQEPQDASHPGGIATGQVVIGGYHMHSITWLENQGIYSWVVVLTILENTSQWEGLSHILWKIKNV
jgi:hypothetical protein